MKPNDSNGSLPANARPFRVRLVAASDRRQYNCPGVDSKARALMLRLADRLPAEWEIDVEDLGNVYGLTHSELQRMRLHVDGAVRMALQLLRTQE